MQASNNEMALGEAAAEAADSFQLLNERITELKDTSTEAAASIEGSWNQLGEVAYQQIGVIGAGAFNAYADAMESSMKTGELSAKSFEKAMKQVLAGTLRTIGQESAMKGAFQLAEGIGAAATLNAPKAALHFASSAKFFSIAAVAGAGAGALSAGSDGGGSRGSSVEPSGREESEDGEDVVQTVTVIGNLDTRDAENLTGQLEEAKKKRDLS